MMGDQRSNSHRWFYVKQCEQLRAIKIKNVEVINFPTATSTDIVENLDKIVENQQPKPLITYVGTNDLTNVVNLLNKKNSK